MPTGKEEITCVPIVALLPDQLALAGEAEAVQELGILLADQVRVVERGAAPDVGEAVKVVAGTEGAHVAGGVCRFKQVAVSLPYILR